MMVCRLPKVRAGAGERDDFCVRVFRKKECGEREKQATLWWGGRKDKASLVTFADASC